MFSEIKYQFMKPDNMHLNNEQWTAIIYFWRIQYYEIHCKCMHSRASPIIRHDTVTAFAALFII